MKGKGNCYEIAGKMIANMPDDTLLCHGTVTGQGQVKGIRFGHAWIELNGCVIDQSNGLKICMKKERYYEIGKIKESKVKKYIKRDALLNLLKYKHFGLWE